MYMVRYAAPFTPYLRAENPPSPRRRGGLGRCSENKKKFFPEVICFLIKVGMLYSEEKKNINLYHKEKAYELSIQNQTP
ncbi:hypothetical protein PCC7424_0259 [Gloeothece citriformis PCC 7424]|uniref:Uncharacterized protein n=1 Tax=Gloeothece citriformis (strain PCC 7424) TaxID=65393 RepID=B7KAQ5_GLOC7|nr:hypothetical protein PCC7424_0259 [Gloeothece citriformis PCC 7424]